jgi:beta-lactamase class A
MKSGILKRWWVVLFVGFALGIGTGWYLWTGDERTTLGDFFVEQREMDSGFQFINPLLACGDENFSRLSTGALLTLEQKANALIAQQKREGKLVEGAVYFRGLNGGSWFGINEDTLFTPGSLLKVPLVMSVYAHEEKNPGFLETSIEYDGGHVDAREHFTSDKIQEGNVYTVEDLVRAVLVHSDNDAAMLLSQLITRGELDQSYAALGIQVPTSGNDYEVRVRTYASFFRILFNATLLSKEHSDHLLALLSETTFHDGIVAGIPKGIVVAHKFGERTQGQNNLVQLHDCGIVYKGTNPFLLCVMMRGNDFNTLSKNIADVAALAYSYAE